MALLSSASLAGCAAPLLGSSMAEAGYGVARGPLGSVFGSSSSPDTAQGRDARQVKLQSVLNTVQVGQDAKPILRAMGEAPKEKSGNPQGYTCYEFPAVYSATAAAVIVARDGKVVSFGNSRCVTEMQEANFRATGKYAVQGGQPAPAGSSASGGGPAPASGPTGSGSDAPDVGTGTSGHGAGAQAEDDKHGAGAEKGTAAESSSGR